MQRRDIKVKAGGGGEFDCYLAMPDGGGKVPAVVLAAAVHGVDADIRGICDRFAQAGHIAAAPDLFWRTVPGPLPRTDERTKTRSQPRLAVLKTGEADMADTLAELKKLPQFNGRAVAMGFCYGGPYALTGPKRLGYAAGVSCHGSQLIDFTAELEGATKPVCIVWGDQDTAAPEPVRKAYAEIAARTKSVEVHIIPGVKHGYMMAGNPDAYSAHTFEFTMARALDILAGLK